MNWFKDRRNKKIRIELLEVQMRHLMDITRTYLYREDSLRERLSIIEKELKELNNAKQMV